MGNDSALVELLEWDTTFFGFRIARVRGETLTLDKAVEIDEWCRQQRVNCLYFLCGVDDPQSTQMAEKSGYHLVDIRTTLERALDDLAKDVAGPFEATIRGADVADVARLQRIAGEVHRDTRFWYDRRFPEQLSRRLYERWITVSCEGYADTVFVAVLDDVPLGYLSCHLDGEQSDGRIGLVGVDERARGHGIGQALVLNAVDWFRRQTMHSVSVVTSGRNFAAQRLYQRCGFVTRSVKLWYHKWYE